MQHLCLLLGQISEHATTPRRVGYSGAHIKATSFVLPIVCMPERFVHILYHMAGICFKVMAVGL